MDRERTLLSSWLEEGRISWGDLAFASQFDAAWAPLFAYLLSSAREGHLCVSWDEEHLYPSWGEWDQVLKPLILHVDHPYLVRDGQSLYLKRNYSVEVDFVHHWHRIKKGCPVLHTFLDKTSLPTVNEEQQAAIEYSCQRSLAWIMGGPGTGKTYLASQLIDLCLHQGVPSHRILGLAPTGKAAANLRRKLAATGVSIQTIHAFLAGHQRMAADLLIIDEGSMIDAVTYTELFSRIRTGAHVIVLGDPDQLPPISSGNFFSVCASREGFRLDRCMRTDAPDLLAYAALVREGKEVPASLLDGLPKRDGDTMILTPLIEGPYGVKALNRHFHDPSAGEIPIVITKNAPHLEIYNGDIGILAGESATIGSRQIPKYELPFYDWAYALSVHKSQGSEYEKIHLLLPEGSERFGKELLYTAITRAKQSIQISAAPGVIQRMVQKKIERISGLRARIALQAP